MSITDCQCNAFGYCHICILKLPYFFVGHKRKALYCLLNNLGVMCDRVDKERVIREAKRVKKEIVEEPSLDILVNDEVQRIKKEMEHNVAALERGPEGLLDKIMKKHEELVGNYGEVIALVFTKEACARAVIQYAPHKKNEMELFIR